ncbi:MAG: M48 family metallopeptidase [Prevotella sp.]|nr:M48 family metallopeptidase [Prevotella sp.]
MANKKIEPLFWINPNFRLQFPYFSIKWYKIEHQVLLQEVLQEGMGKMVYQTKKNQMMIVLRNDHSGLDLIYSDFTQFDNLRLQSWLRINIRDQIIKRANEVLPHRFHELETIKQIKAKGVKVKKLRKRILGQCNAFKIISLSPVLVIFPIDFLDMVILHEMAHLKYMHHRKTFWAYLSVLINDDAKQQNDLRDIVLSKYIDLYEFLMK